MPYRDLHYYINTIHLKVSAQLCDWADQLNLLESSKKKTQTIFSELYAMNFPKGKILINTSFSKEYTSYRFFSKADDLETHLQLNTEDGIFEDVLQKNSLFPAYFALVCYNDFILERNTYSIKKFWVQTQYLEKRGTEQKNGLAFIYEEDSLGFDVHAPWYSGITQGLIASVFVRAFDLTKNAAYKEKARQTIEATFVSIEDNGVFCETPEGFDWIEEYPSVSRRSLVLLGFIFNIVALYEYLIVCDTENQILEKRLERLVESLFKSLHHYIRGRFVKYSRFSKSFQNISYQGLMVFQFLHLAELSGNKVFYDIALFYHEKMDWNAYFRFYKMLTPSNFEEFYIKKNNTNFK